MEDMKQIQSLNAKPRIWHWRSKGGAEVDLLLERDGVMYPIEIKLKSNPNRHDTRGIRAFADSYPNLVLGPRIIVHGGTRLSWISDDCIGVPVGLV